MEITDIKIRRIITEGRLRAVVSVTVDNMLAVHDIKVVQGDERLFVAKTKTVYSAILCTPFLPPPEK
mgnify:CR=1 FL=1